MGNAAAFCSRKSAQPGFLHKTYIGYQDDVQLQWGTGLEKNTPHHRDAWRKTRHAPQGPPQGDDVQLQWGTGLENPHTNGAQAWIKTRLQRATPGESHGVPAHRSHTGLIPGM